ncbi:MAG: tol-pal system protein YbgF [Deltaproteobacteria bacterium]|nr:tol-pal system protein YbgF [Deltaproteobacteria bacterium]
MRNKTGLLTAAAIAFALAASLGGCAAMEEHEKTLADLNRQVADLKAQQTASAARMDELDNRFHLLQEKLQSAQAARPAEAAQAMPPEGLKVVSLGVDDKTGGKAADKTAARRSDDGAAVAAGQGSDKIEVEDLAAGTAAQAQAEPGPDALYARGQDLFMAGRYAEAREAFGRLAELYPKHGLADNALYWTGETHYSEKSFQKALDVFLDAVERYPKGNKAPDSMLKAGFSYMEVNNPERARETLSALLARYPDSEAAVRAKKTLSRLGGAKK